MIAQNIEQILKHISEIVDKCGRTNDSVRLVAVSKRFPIEVIREAGKAGQFLFGENYIQEAQKKYDQLGDEYKFHFIGHLQTNKAKIASQIFSMVETVDTIKLASALNRHLEETGRKLDILVQVNIGLDDNKSGVTAETTEKLLIDIAELSMLRPRGLMTMPPFTADPEDSRPYFRELKQLAERLRKKNLFHDNKFVELSMGMTNDYHIAIEEGATLVRIGTAIFGQRPINR